MSGDVISYTAFKREDVGFSVPTSYKTIDGDGEEYNEKRLNLVRKDTEEEDKPKSIIIELPLCKIINRSGKMGKIKKDVRAVFEEGSSIEEKMKEDGIFQDYKALPELFEQIAD